MTRAIEEWFSHVPYQELTRSRIGATLAYVVGEGFSPQAFAPTLEKFIGGNLGHLALPKLAAIAYDVDDSRAARAYAQLGAERARSQLAVAGDKRARSEAAEALLESLGWIAEAERYGGSPARSARSIENALEAVGQVAHIVRPRQLHRALGDFYSTRAETLAMSGRLKEAETDYRAAERHMRIAGDWNFARYCTLKMADVHALRGRLTRASVEHRRLIELATATGWKTWLYLQIRIAQWDTAIVAGWPLTDIDWEELDWTADKNQYDDAQQHQARVLRWVAETSGLRVRPSRAAPRDIDKIEATAAAENNARIVATLYKAEFAKRAGNFPAAGVHLRRLLVTTRRKNYRLAHAYGRILSAELASLEGRSWPALRRDEMVSGGWDYAAFLASILERKTDGKRSLVSMSGRRLGLASTTVREFLDSAESRLPMHIFFPGLVTNL